MMKHMKWIGLFTLLLILAACGNQGESDDKTTSEGPKFETVYTEIENALKETLMADGDMSEDEVLMGYFIEDLTATDDEASMVDVLLERMDLDPSKLANGKAIGNMMNVNADEIILLEAKDEADVDLLKESLENELAAQVQTWEQYLPDQYEKVKNNRIETKGKYLLYVTFSDPDKIISVFNEQFKK